MQPDSLDEQAIKIVRQLCESSIDGLKWDAFYENALKNPENYTAEIKQRTETRKYGSQTIPHAGAIIDAETYEYLDRHPTEYRAHYPELKSGKRAGIIDRVRAVSFPDSSGDVLVSIDRYVIRRKQDAGQKQDSGAERKTGHSNEKLSAPASHKTIWKESYAYRAGWISGFYDMQPESLLPTFAGISFVRLFPEAKADFLEGYSYGMATRKDKMPV